MSPDASLSAADPVFTLDFNAYVSGHYNRDLGGKGRLSVRPDEPRFVFTGFPRGRFFIGKTSAELALRSEQIWNVEVHGAGVALRTNAGKSGAKQAPFVFTCASATDAAAVAALLPATKDAGFLADESFIAQLRQLPDAGGGLRSITNLILVANVGVFVAMGLLGAGWFEVASLRPYMLYGANNAAATADGEWWRLVSSMFLHFGALHLLLNCWALFQAGPLVEKLFGRALFALVYFGSGVLGSMTTLLWHGDRMWSAGASGAVFGVYGALLGYLWREKHGVPAGIFRPMLKSTLVFAGYNLFYGAVHPNIDNTAHLGGLLGGVLLGWLCALPLDPGMRARLRRPRARAGLLAAAALTGAGMLAAPRYDYRVREELAWSAATKEPIARERTLIAAEHAAFRAYSETGDTVALTRWVTAEALPFYQEWRRQLDRMPLTAGRATSQRRAELTRAIQIKTDAFRRLLADARAGAPDLLQNYAVAQKQLSTRKP